MLEVGRNLELIIRFGVEEVETALGYDSQKLNNKLFWLLFELD
jgi:hypothetical protein